MPIPRGIQLEGKTFLGGIIGINNLLLGKQTQKKLSKLVYALRHEISHKKWQINRTNGNFTMRPPSFQANGTEYTEAGYYLDEAIYGSFGDGLNFKNMDEDICRKIEFWPKSNRRRIDEASAKRKIHEFGKKTFWRIVQFKKEGVLLL